LLIPWRFSRRGLLVQPWSANGARSCRAQLARHSL